MSTANTLEQLNGFFKESYAEKLKKLIPEDTPLMNAIEFMSAEKQPGGNYNQPVILGLEHGITFGSSDDDAFNLNPSISGVTKNAQVKGHPLVLRSAMGYTAASRAAQGGKQAFEDASKYLVANMLRSVAKKLEIEMLYGQMGYATVASNSSTVVTLTTAEWAPGIWAGAEGMPIEIRDTTGATSKGEFVVSAVSFENRTITLNADPGTLASGDVVWHKGAYGNEFVGIHKMLSQSSGTLFGINVASYALWKGTTYSAASGALSFSKLNKAVARAAEKGMGAKKLLCLVNPRAWSDLLNDQAALRKYDASYSSSKFVNGAKALEFHAHQATLEIMSSIYVKEGYAYLLSIEDFSRVGSSDVSFNRRGREGEYFRELENTAGWELRIFADMALFNCAVGRSVLIDGIVNAS
jgi:hypothetical protein